MIAPPGTTPVTAINPDLFQDPYAWWGLQTRFRAFMRAQTSAPSELTFLVELHTPYRSDTHFTEAQATARSPALASVQAAADGDGARRVTIGGVRLQVPLVYERVLPAKRDSARFITLRLSTDALPQDPAQRTAKLQALVQQLITTKEVKRMQIGFQRPAYRDKPQDGAVPGTGQSRTTPLGKPPAVVLGVVEDACPFGHVALRNAAGSRVLALWDQSLRDPGTQPGLVTAPWTSPAEFPYGRTLSQQAMTALLDEFTTDGWVDEPALYADPRVCMFALLQRKSHAAAVMDLLAGGSAALGRGVMDDGVPVPPPTPSRTAADATVLAAPLVVVQLPREQTAISAGRWLAVNALDALHFVIDSARQLVSADQPPPPLVVNVSYGAIAGPHDGTSLLESAVDELCQGYPNMAVVLAAGNAQGILRDTDNMDQCAYLPGGVHAKHDLLPGQAVTLTLLVPADKPFETYLELWFSVAGTAVDADHWLDPAEVAVEVTSPSGSVLTAACGEQDFNPAQGPPPGNPAWLPSTTSGLVFVRKASQSLHRSMALLVVAATRVHPDFVEAPAGCWTLKLSNRRPTNGRKLEVQAWVERDDSTYGIDRPQSARLVPNADGASQHLDDHNILSNLASGRNTLAVGALVQRDLADPAHWMVSPYSATGPSMSDGPALSALADAGVALSGVRTAGSQSGMVLRTNGTSMAAPLAARWIAQQLALPRTLADIKDELELANANHPNARRGMSVP